MPDGAQLVTGNINNVPLYSADYEASNGAPVPVKELRRQLDTAGGLLLATPEYNNGIPGVFKNVIDWMASGSGAQVFVGKPVAVMGASPMVQGTILAQDAWWPVLRALRTRPWFEGRLMIGNAQDHFDDAGNLTDVEMRARLESFVRAFVASI